jgi:hypothetical protein
LRVVLDTPGTYQVMSSMPGQDPMAGTLVVVAR